MDLNEMFQKYLDMSDEERNNIATVCVGNIVDYLRQYYSDDTVLQAVIQMFAVFCCVDGVVNQDEYNLFINATGVDVSYDDFYEATKTGTHEDVIQELYEFLNEQDNDFVSEVFVLAICLLTSNGTLTVAEQEFIDEFFG